MFSILFWRGNFSFLQLQLWQTQLSKKWILLKPKALQEKEEILLKIQEAVNKDDLVLIKKLKQDIYLLNDYIDGYGKHLAKELNTLYEKLQRKYPNNIEQISQWIKQL